jgi:signal recognition particle receptor subunit beta
VPGKESFRGMWSNYLEEIEGLIYLVDVNRPDIENSIQILSKEKFIIFQLDEFLGNKHLQKAELPILILINKIVQYF